MQPFETDHSTPSIVRLNRPPRERRYIRRPTVHTRQETHANHICRLVTGDYHRGFHSRGFWPAPIRATRIGQKDKESGHHLLSLLRTQEKRRYLQLERH